MMNYDGDQQIMWHRVKREWGFTMIEMMIVVAIISIIAAIAYPSYQDSMRKSRRADAKSVLLHAAQWMERYYTENNRYDRDRGIPPVPVALPTALSQSPIGGAKIYDIALVDCGGAATVAANSFTLSAKPIAGSDQAKDLCGGLTLTSTGTRGVCGSETVDRCWR